MRKSDWIGVNHTGFQGPNSQCPTPLPLYRLISDRYRQDHPYEEAQVGNFSAPVPSFYIQDHLGNTRVTYEMDCGPLGARRNLEYVGDYLPYGGILREHFVDRRERFLTTEHERDEQTQLDYRGARYSDSRWGVFMSVDPLASEFPSWSPYSYTTNNPIRFIDPDGRMAVDAQGVDDWYEDENGEIQYNADIKSQEGLDAAGIQGTYLGEKGFGIDPSTGLGMNFNSDGSISLSLNVLSEVNVTANASNLKGLASNFTDAIGGLGTGFGAQGGSIRLTNGAYNGDAFSPKYYKSGWGGGSTARIRTYGLGTTGSLLSRGGAAGALAFGAYDIGVNAYNEGGFGTYTQRATGRTTGSILGGTGGAYIGAGFGSLFGGFGAIPGGIIGGLLGGYGGSKAGEESVKYFQD